MNIDDLTMGQIKELVAMFGQNSKKECIRKRYIGEYVLVRTYMVGVVAGVVVDLDESGVILKEARRLHYHAPKNQDLSWYEGVALSGLAEKSRCSSPESRLINGDYEITLVSRDAEESIRWIKTYAQK